MYWSDQSTTVLPRCPGNTSSEVYSASSSGHMQHLDCGLPEPALSRLQCLVWDPSGVSVLLLLPSSMPETSKSGCRYLDFRSETQHLAIQLLHLGKASYF